MFGSLHRQKSLFGDATGAAEPGRQVQLAAAIVQRNCTVYKTLEYSVLLIVT